MSYIEQFFGKRAENMVYQDIVKYFSAEQVESDKIEFKSYNTNGKLEDKYEAILKTICGFLNSAGGLLIWGAPKVHKKDIGGKSVQVTGNTLEPLDKFIEKDAFINKVISSITPSPNGILFYSINDGKSYIYLIDVAQSSYSPHQYNNSYYMRMDGQNKLAPHHYIEALFKKISYPKLEIYLSIGQLQRKDNVDYCLEIKFGVFNLSKFQHEKSANCKILLDSSMFFWDYNKAPEKYRSLGREISVESGLISHSLPFIYDESVRIKSTDLNSKFTLSILVTGENAPTIVSAYQIHIKNGVTTTNEYIIGKYENKHLFEITEGNVNNHNDFISNAMGRKIYD